MNAHAAPVVDLHTHSTASDGTDSPTGLVEAARAAGIDVLAVTDHDTTAGWAEAVAAGRRLGVAILPGIEITCRRGDQSVHLLGYLPDPEHPALTAELARARSSRSTRLERMVALMAADGVPITYDEVLAQVAPGATPGRPHIADALIANGTVGHRDEAFARWLSESSPYYVHHHAPDPVDAVALVLAAGGVAVHAHPFTPMRGQMASEELVEELAAAGLAGLEVDHRDHDDAARHRGYGLAKRLGLLVTGSSDYHGEGKLNRLGENTTSPEALARIEELATGPTRVVRP